MDKCPICDGEICTNEDYEEECELCGTTFTIVPKEKLGERVKEIMGERYAQLSKEIWGR